MCVAAHDIPYYADTIVYLRCDYCGSVFSKTNYKFNLHRERSPIKKDCCKHCRQRKAYESQYDDHEYKGAVNEYLRGTLVTWKIDSMKQCDFKDVIDGGDFDVIHHLFSFNFIVDEVFKELQFPYHKEIEEYSTLELDMIATTTLKLHYKYPLGVCLSNENHSLFHSEYGYGNNTPEQFEEFKNKVSVH